MYLVIHCNRQRRHVIIMHGSAYRPCEMRCYGILPVPEYLHVVSVCCRSAEAHPVTRQVCGPGQRVTGGWCGAGAGGLQPRRLSDTHPTVVLRGGDRVSRPELCRSCLAPVLQLFMVGPSIYTDSCAWRLGGEARTTCRVHVHISMCCLLSFEACCVSLPARQWVRARGLEAQQGPPSHGCNSTCWWRCGVLVPAVGQLPGPFGPGPDSTCHWQCLTGDSVLVLRWYNGMVPPIYL